MQFKFQNLCHIILYGKIVFFSAFFVQYKCCGSHICVRFHGKIMPNSVSFIHSFIYLTSKSAIHIMYIIRLDGVQCTHTVHQEEKPLKYEGGETWSIPAITEVVTPAKLVHHKTTACFRFESVIHRLVTYTAHWDWSSWCSW